MIKLLLLATRASFSLRGNQPRENYLAATIWLLKHAVADPLRESVQDKEPSNF
jgi:hypothetical protein